MGRRKMTIPKEMGTRLKECREAAGFTREMLEEIESLGLSSGMVHKLESGERHIITYVDGLALVLGVTREYLLCESDSKYPVPHGGWFIEDEYFLKFLIERGYDLQAWIVLLFQEGQPQKIVTFSELSEFDFHTSTCKYEEHEVQIARVTINGIETTFQEFCFLMKSLYHQIDNALRDLKEFEGKSISASGDLYSAAIINELSDLHTRNTSFPPQTTHEKPRCPKNIEQQQRTVDIETEITHDESDGHTIITVKDIKRKHYRDL